MVLKLARTLLTVAALSAVSFSTAANAATYDVSFDVTSLFGNAKLGSGYFDVSNLNAGIDTLPNDDLSITVDKTTFFFPQAFASFNKSGKLVDLVGLDVIGGPKGDSVALSGIFGGLFGLFTDDSGRRPILTAFKITDISEVDPSPTPLPSTWVMMLFGLIGLGFIAYRGGKKQTRAGLA
jgi:hypothetical protein